MAFSKKLHFDVTPVLIVKLDMGADGGKATSITCVVRTMSRNLHRTWRNAYLKSPVHLV